MVDALNDQNIEFHLVAIFEKLETLRNENVPSVAHKIPMQVEIRTLEFWRSVTSECLASFIYVFVVCGAAAGAGINLLLATALSAGFCITSLTQCFGHISGAHVNPAVTVAMGVTKRISVLRSILFLIAQCGGGIAGAAFLYGVGVPTTMAHVANIGPWERFGIEFILCFIIVFTYFVSMDTYRKWTGTSSLTIGAAYAACTFVSMPYLNPARSLGPSFVLSRWENHWVFWLGPLMGGVASGLIYEYIFNPNRYKKVTDPSEDDSSSIRSDEDTYDDLDKPTPPKFHGSTYNTYRSANGDRTNAPGYCPSLTTASLYSAPPTKLERVESLYGGTKSLYCKSPPLTRANLNRSQSVYTKSNSAVNRDILPKPGPLVPAQSLYPMRLNPQNHVQTQNMQNQMQQRSESIYGVRGVTPGTATRPENYATTERSIYGSRTNPNPHPTDGGKYGNDASKYGNDASKYGTDASSKYGNDATKYVSDTENAPSKGATSRRPESMYGMLSSQARRVQTGQSDDSSYGSFVGPSARTNPPGATTYLPPNNPNNYLPPSQSNYPPNTRNTTEARQNTQQQTMPSTSSATYHHQHSPNPQY